jgi:hypothetical protein
MESELSKLGDKIDEQDQVTDIHKKELDLAQKRVVTHAQHLYKSEVRARELRIRRDELLYD